jgi:short-subunit dehydrogenase
MAPRIPMPQAVSDLINGPTGVAGRNIIRRLRRSGGLKDAVRDKVILITGASSGIGEAAARWIGGAGGEVLLVARTREKLEVVRGDIEDRGGTAHVHPCDLSDLDAVGRLADEVLERHGRVDVLVNNAGRSIRRSIDLSYDRFHDFERTMELNYLAPVRLILALLPGMRERRSGHIVNVSTAGVDVRVPRFSAYIASKAALDAFSDCISAEIAQDDVRITSIHMPLVRTPMIEPTKIYRSFPALTPEQAAARICQAIVHRPRRIGTPFGNVAAVADAVSPESLDAVRTAGYQLFPDSRAARGGEGGDGAEQASTAGRVFARILRGIHW